MSDESTVKILIVDDLPENRLVYQSILSEPTLEVICAGSGSEALQLLLHHEFAVILLDVNMPDMSGFETAAMIRSRKRCAHTPIIFVTAYADELHTLEGYSKGAVDYILSPVIADILKSKVRVFVRLFRLTQHVREQAAAAEQESARLAAVLESAPDLFGRIDLQGRFIHLNRAGRKMLGLGSRDPLPADLANCTPTDDAAQLLDVALPTTLREGVWFGEAVLRDRSSREIPVSLVLQAYRRPGGDAESISIIARDISQRIQAQQESRLLQTLSLAIGSAQDLNQAITVTLQEICSTTKWDYGETWLPDETKRTLHCAPVHFARGAEFLEFSQAASRMFLAPGDGLPGRVWGTRQPEWLRDLRDPRQFSRAKEAEAVGLRSAVAVPVFAGAEIAAVLIFAMRSTRNEDARLVSLVSAAAAPLGPLILRKRAEAELSRHRDRLEELVQDRTMALKASLERLRVADRLASIGTLAAGLGHDMGNLLLPVRLRLEALEGMNLPPDAQEDLAAIKTASDYLRRLSQGLRLFALDPDDPDDSHEGTELQPWWEMVEAFLRSALPKTVSLEFDLPQGLAPLDLPAHRFTQVIYNLVKNAGDAMLGSPGCVRITASASADDERIMIAIQDNGPGMSEKVRRRCMEPFFTTKTRGISTGLGLALVRGAVLKAGGSIELESQLGAGTTFRLSLPSVRRANTPSRLHSRATALALVRLRNQRLAAYCEAMLNSMGYVVEATHDVSLTDSVSLMIVDGQEAANIDLSSFLAKDARRRAVLIGSSAELEIPSDQIIVLPGQPAHVRLRHALENVVDQMRMNSQEVTA